LYKDDSGYIKQLKNKTAKTRMWANAQRDAYLPNICSALFNAAKFG